MKSIKFLTLLLVMSIISTTLISGSELNNRLSALSKQIITSMTKNKALMNKNKKVTIAVIEFPTIEGKSTLLGRSISEQLTTKLYLTKKFDIIELTKNPIYCTDPLDSGVMHILLHTLIISKLFSSIHYR